MSTMDFDLKAAVAQANSLIADILETSKTLILDVKASHYWTTYCLNSFAQVRNIIENLGKLIEITRPQWEKSASDLFDEPKGIKLWMTATGLLRALPPVRAKLTEQLSLRRRQRIMGQTIEESEEVSQEMIEEDLAVFRTEHASLRDALVSLDRAVESVPDALAPTPEQVNKALLEAARKKAISQAQEGGGEASMDGEVESTVAVGKAPLESTSQAGDGVESSPFASSGSQAESSTPAARDGDSGDAVANPDEMSPV
jgi:hypothetical protein